MNTATYAALLVCALSGAAFAVCGPYAAWVKLTAFAAGLLVGVVVVPILPIAGLGLIAGVVGGALLWRDRWTLLAAFAAGVLAAGAGLLLTPLLGPTIGWIAAVAGYVFSTGMARQPGFVSNRMRDEALSLVALLGLGAAALPGIAAGWQTALALRVAPGTVPAVPAWVVWAGCTSAALGAVYSYWRRAS
jgi:hypothetical protein